MNKKANLEVRAKVGVFNRSVACRLGEGMLEVERGGNVQRVGYDEIVEIRFQKRRSGRSVLGIQRATGRAITLRVSSGATSDEAVNDFVKSLCSLLAATSPDARVVIGPSRTQWVASWGGLFASGAVLLFAVWSLLAGDNIGSMLMPIGISLVNLAVVVPILRSGRPHQYSVAEALLRGL
ncbi:hypothetical protein HAT86_15730 [Roseovarius gahaiensis]|uniref:Uncharacterized protein n=1 Tax=Roseovarius gahaiensis TaxID=2716691 RepID=A0A967BD91_9RHOB|nr:hypothetical protein [Roseovarius gahaiensis]NHQ75900.1 hypothetical protein [Roseovarius gahaiensis]